MILDFSTGNSVTYYGIGYFWTNGAGGSNSPGGLIGRYRTLLGVGV